MTAAALLVALTSLAVRLYLSGRGGGFWRAGRRLGLEPSCGEARTR